MFTILQKEKEHYSSIYDNAPMPFMERLTWDGIALHAGKLADYPVSHGCVRLPAAFAAKLYEITQVGTPVIIASDHTAARIGVRSGSHSRCKSQAGACQGRQKDKAEICSNRSGHVDPRFPR